MTADSLLLRRITISAAFGAATGLVAVMLAVVADHVVLTMLRDASMQPFDLTARVIADLAERTSLPLPSSPAAFAALGVAALATFGAAAGALLHRLRLDPNNHVGVSLAWAWRALLTAWPATVAITLAVAALHFFATSPAVKTYLLTFIFLLPLVFGIFSPRTASSADAARWWLPQWPGWRCAAGIGTICVASFAFTVVAYLAIRFIDADGGSAWQTTLVGLGSCVTDALLCLAVAMLLVRRLRLSDLWHRRAALVRRDVLAPWFTGMFALHALALPAILLQLAVSAFDVFVRPQVEQDAETGRAMAALAHMGCAATGLQVLAATALALTCIAGWLMQARLVHVLPGATAPIELSAARVETPADRP